MDAHYVEPYKGTATFCLYSVGPLAPTHIQSLLWLGPMHNLELGSYRRRDHINNNPLPCGGTRGDFRGHLNFPRVW